MIKIYNINDMLVLRLEFVFKPLFEKISSVLIVCTCIQNNFQFYIRHFKIKSSDRIIFEYFLKLIYYNLVLLKKLHTLL